MPTDKGQSSQPYTKPATRWPTGGWAPHKSTRSRTTHLQGQALVEAQPALHRTAEARQALDPSILERVERLRHDEPRGEAHATVHSCAQRHRHVDLRVLVANEAAHLALGAHLVQEHSAVAVAAAAALHFRKRVQERVQRLVLGREPQLLAEAGDAAARGEGGVDLVVAHRRGGGGQAATRDEGTLMVSGARRRALSFMILC
jgi:hypothetical protein